MKTVYLTLILIIFAVIILLPPIIHGYIYPTMGQDTAAHLDLFDKIKIGSPIPVYSEVTPGFKIVRYYGYYIIGYPLDLIHLVTNVSKDTLFFWFNYLALIGVGFSLFYVFKKLLGIWAGLLALIIPLFTSYGLLSLWYSGTIFNVINMGIILPFVVYFVIQALANKQKRYWIWTGILALLFLSFHTSGLYLPFFVVACVAAFVEHKIWVSKKKLPWILSGLAILVGAFVVFWFLKNLGNDGNYGDDLANYSLLRYLTISTSIIYLVSLFCIIFRKVKVTPTERLLWVGFVIMGGVLLIPVYFGWSPQPFRQGIDSTILLSMAVVAQVSVIIRTDTKKYLVYALVALSVIGALPNLYGWFGYNSALTKVDKEAINYVNQLPITYYSVSSNVDATIYGRFIKKIYMPTEGEIIITRNHSMPSITPDGDVSLRGRVEIKEFSDSKITVEIYQ